MSDVPHAHSAHRLAPREKWLLALLSALLLYPAWVRGGTYTPIQAPLPWLGLLVLLAVFAVPVLSWRDVRSADVLRAMTARVLGDPIFYLGLGLLALLVVQWGNAGRSLVFDPAASRWIYTLPRIRWLPSAVTKAEAREMLIWFFPAWAAVLSVRSGLLGHRALRRLFGVLVASAVPLAAFGLVQYASGTKSIYWIHPVETEFFATFGYANHAASYFLLMMCLAAGLGIRAFAKARRGRAWLPAVGYGMAFLLCLAAANLSLSRAAILLSWFITGFAACCLIGWNWFDLAPAARLNLVAGSLATVVLGFFLTAAMGMEALEKELVTLTKPYLGAKGTWLSSFPVAVSLSLTAGFLSACGLVGFAWRARRAASGKGLALALVVLSLCHLPAVGRVGGEAARESQASSSEKKVGGLEERRAQMGAAVRIWKDHPWFGVGGWGYRYFLGMYLDPVHWKWIKPGKANVHNDPLQFLVEFGAVGAGLMAGIAWVLAAPLRRSGTWRGHAVLLPLLGVGLVFLQSLIDLPFRCPAVLYTWLVILAALPVIGEGHGHGHEE